MNLCGDIVNVTEHEMVMELPEDHFSMKYGRKSSSSTPSNRRRKGTRSSSRSRSRRAKSPSLAAGDSDSVGPGLLNPISREDLKKSRSRHGRKTPTGGGLKKLEDGFDLKIFIDEKETRNINLSLDHDQVYLRVRSLDKDLNLRKNVEDSENDRSESNFGDIRLKVQELKRIEGWGDKYLTSKGSLIIPINGFAVVMKRSVGDSRKFIFEAETLAERDTIMGALKGLIDPNKFSEDSSRRQSSRSLFREAMASGSSHKRRDLVGYNNGSQRDLVGYNSSSHRRMHHGYDRSNESYRKSRTSFQMVDEKRDRKVETDDVLCVSDDDERIIDTCSQRVGRIEIGSDEKKDRPREAREPREDRLTGASSPKTDKASPGKHSPEASKGQELSITVVKNNSLREIGVEVAEFDWGIDDILCGRQPKSNSEAPTGDTNEKDLRTREIKASLLNSGCHPLSGCQSQALAAVEDAEMAAMANQIANPWCTDDICTTSLKDFSDTMCGIFEMKQKSREEKYPDSEKQKAMAEEYISGVLGRQTAMTTLTKIWNPASKRRNRKKKRIQNRVAQSGGQARRLSRLRNKMTFHAATTTKTIPFLQVVNSADDIDVVERWTGNKRLEKSNLDNLGGSPDFFGNARTETKQFDTENEDLYYDSDPGDTREQSHKKGPRRIIADAETFCEETYPRRETLSGISMKRLLVNRRWKKHDDEIITEVIENMKNETITLIWHPTQTKTNQNLSPLCVKARIESGVYLIDGTFLLPKLSWLPFHEEELHSKQLNIGKGQAESLDLLDVCRVRECDEINRELHPYAPTDRSFIVQTQSGLYLFETESRQERSRIVVGLKLVIARLASLLMLRDLRAVDEFFGGNSVPGEAPSWAAGKNEQDQNDAGPEFPAQVG